MTTLITALADAHRALLADPNAADKTLATTARKVESTLIEQVKSLKADGFTREIAVALLNSGSLKALKMAPKTDAVYRPVYGSTGPDAKFILAQPITYLREALNRGFAMDDTRRMEMLESMADGESVPTAILTDGPVSPHLADNLLGWVLTLDAAKAALVAPTVTKLLKTALKEQGDALARDLETLFVIHDLSLASDTLFKAIVAHALLGTKKPKQDAIELKEMEDLARDMFSTTGRKDLRDTTNGLEAWLAQGSPLPKALTSLDQKRNQYRAYTPRRRF